MPDLTTPLFVAAAFVGIGWLIADAGRDHADAIGHTLTVFALAFGLLVLGGTMSKLRLLLGAGRMVHRVEARSQIEPPAPNGRTRCPGKRAAFDQIVRIIIPEYADAAFSSTVTTTTA